MRTDKTGNTLTLYLEGRIDSNNALQMEEESLSAVKEHPDADLALDAKDLEYISSAGFERTLLRRIEKFHNNYFLWVEDFNLPTTNNLSSTLCKKSFKDLRTV